MIFLFKKHKWVKEAIAILKDFVTMSLMMGEEDEIEFWDTVIDIAKTKRDEFEGK